MNTKYFLSVKKTILITIGIILLFLPVYHFLLKELLLKSFTDEKDSIDKLYYTAIFSNGELALIIIILILCCIFFLFKPIKKILVKISAINVLLICILIQFVVQVLILVFIDTIPISDSIFYLDHGIRLAETGSYISPQGHYTAFWPVALPAMIASFEMAGLDPVLFMKFYNILFSAILLLVIFFFFRRMLTENRMKLFLLFFTLYPNNLFSAQPILTELPFTLAIWLSFYISLVSINKKGFWLFFISGIVIGISALFRANGLLLIPVIFILILYTREEILKRTVLFLLGTILILAPWTYRNYYHFHKLLFTSTNGGYIFLMGNHPNASGKVNFDFEYDTTNPDEVGEERQAYQKGLEAIINDPAKFISRIPLKFFYSYYRGDHAITWSLKSTNNNINPLFKSFIFFSANGYFYGIIFLSLVGFIVRRKNFSLSPGIMLMIFYLISIFLMIAFFCGSERYIIPIIPIHLFFAVKGLTID